MSVLVAIEGGDGAGKATAAANVADALRKAGRTAAVLSFPRYGDTVGGLVLGDFLAGRLGRDVTSQAAAVLYALDRLESRDHLLHLADTHDVLVLDRYVASNMAYQAAKLPADEGLALMRWILRLELDQFAMPPADLSVYLDTDVDVARGLIAQKRQRSYTERTYDEHEADLALQRRVRESYAAMAEASLGGRWVRVAGAPRDPASIAAEIAGLIG